MSHMMQIHKNFKIRWGMVIDIDKCTGCGACVIACHNENNLPPPTDPFNRLRTLHWLIVYKVTNNDPENFDVVYIPRPCMQCGNPSCASVCPVVATTKDEEGGIVSQIYPRCIGCRYCMAACPYHARVFNWFDPVWPKGMEKELTPFVSVRPRGVVEKCTFCHHRFQQAKERARKAGRDPLDIKEGEYIPACAEACPTNAIVFGDLNNPSHKVYKLARSKYAFRLLERLGTEPQVYYISRRKWVKEMVDNYLIEKGEKSHDRSQT